MSDGTFTRKGAGMSMTARQRAFAEAYAGNATEAAIKAGYSEKSARKIGQENLTKPDISQAIRERENRQIKPLIAARQRRQEFWTRVMDDPEVEMKDRLRASELLAKSEGDFLVRVEHGGDVAPDLRGEIRALLLEREEAREIA